MTVRLHSAFWLFSIFCGLIGQTVAAANVSVTDPATLYVLFLGHHAKDATYRSTASRLGAKASKAGLMHVRPQELRFIDQKAAEYALADRQIHQEAVRYRAECIRAGRPLSPSVVHSFTMRRAAKATAIFVELQAGLPPDSYLGLHQYLNSVFRQSLKSQSVR